MIWNNTFWHKNLFYIKLLININNSNLLLLKLHLWYQKLPLVFWCSIIEYIFICYRNVLCIKIDFSFFLNKNFLFLDNRKFKHWYQEKTFVSRAFILDMHDPCDKTFTVPWCDLNLDLPQCQNNNSKFSIGHYLLKNWKYSLHIWQISWKVLSNNTILWPRPWTLA